MNYIKLNIKVQKAFGNLYRKKLALIAVQDLEGNILVGSKPNFYPEGISRLLGGALRELEEELGVIATINELVPLINVDIHAIDEEGNVFENRTYVFFYKLKGNKYKAGDDVKQIKKLSIDELYQLGENYDSLRENNWYEGVEGKYSWGDYGKVYGPIHKLTAQKIGGIKRSRK